jgi:hypothetical protein
MDFRRGSQNQAITKKRMLQKSRCTIEIENPLPVNGPHMEGQARRTRPVSEETITKEPEKSERVQYEERSAKSCQEVW